MIKLPTHKCPECGYELSLYANGDNGPQDDRWTCDTCCIEFPHSEFPLPKGYVKHAREIEAARELEYQQEEDRRKLNAWNKWASASR